MSSRSRYWQIAEPVENFEHQHISCQNYTLQDHIILHTVNPFYIVRTIHLAISRSESV